jgi:hypothetical protein
VLFQQLMQDLPSLSIGGECDEVCVARLAPGRDGIGDRPDASGQPSVGASTACVRSVQQPQDENGDQRDQSADHAQ